MRISVVFITSYFFLQSVAITSGQPNLPTNLKADVYRIIREAGEKTTIEATGVMFGEGNHRFLITNLHVVQCDTNRFCDSMFIFLNRVLPNGDVISGPTIRKVYLKKDGNDFLFEPSVPNLDLALIHISKRNTDFEPEDSIYAVSTSSIVNIELLKQRGSQPTVVTVIGYPSKETLLLERTPEYLWGDLLGVWDDSIYTNAPIHAGNSGSLVVARTEGHYYLLGIVYGLFKYRKIAAVIPAGSINSCFERYFDQIRKRGK